ncbi:MAG: hypothetical protein K1V99_03100 [Bacteroidales bacterium]
MANIEELDFTVILDDQDFNAKVQKDIKLAKDLNVSLSTLLESKRKVNSIDKETVVNNRRVLQMETDLVRATELRNREKVRTEGLQRRINAQIEAANKGYKTQGKILNELKGLAATYLSVQGAQKVLSSLVRVTGEFEMQRTTLRAMLGDLDQADRIISQMKELAVVSPFEFKDLTTYAKQLAAYSVPVNEIYDTTKMLADVSSGLGVGMDRLILAYGQVRSAAFLRGQEVRQFTEAGIPILDELAKQFSELEGRAISAGEVFDKISARLVPFEMVEKVFKNLTSEGGKFYNMQEVQAETLQGKLSNLKDAYEIMLSEIGEANIDRMKGAVDWTRRLMENYEDIGKTIKALVIAFGSYKVALGIVTVATNGFQDESLKLVKGLRKIATFAAANPYIALAAGVGVLVGVIYKAATAQSTFEKMADASNKAVSEYNKNTESELSLMNYLLGRMGKLKQGTSEYNDVKSELLRNYGQYLSDVDKEKIAIGDLAGIYDKLSQSIRNSAREKALQKGNDEITEAYNQEYEFIYKNVDKLIKRAGVYENKGLRQELADYVRGIIKLEDLSEEAKEARNKLVYNKDLDLSYLDNYRDLLIKLEEETARQRDQLSTNLEFTFGVEPKPKVSEENLTKFVETVQNTLEKKFGVTKDNKGIAAALWVEPTTEYYGYLEDIRKAYKGINQKIKDTGTTQKDNVKNLKKQKEMIEEIAKALGISLKEEDYKNYKHKPKSQEQISIESEIASLRKLQDLYEKFKKYNVDDADISKLFLGYFPDLTKKYGEDFITKLDFLNRAVELTRELAKYDPEGAQRILTSLGVSASDEDLEKLEEAEKRYKKASAAAKELYESMRKWSTEDYNIEGTGIAHDISKINTGLSTTLNEIDLKAQKLKETLSQIDAGDETAIAKIKETFVAEFGENAWQPFWDSYVTGGKDAINKFAAAEKEYEKKLAQEKINDLAKKYITEKTSGLNLKEWGDKTLTQVIRIKRALDELANGDIEISDELKTAIAEAGLTLDEFTSTVKQGFATAGSEASAALGTKLVGVAQKAIQALSGVSSAMHELAEASGDETLSETAEQVDFLADTLSNVLEGFKSGNWIGAAVALATSVIQGLVEGIENAKKEKLELEKNRADFLHELEMSEIQFDASKFEGMFGTDELEKAMDAVKKRQQAQEKLDALMEEMNSHTMAKNYEDKNNWNGWAWSVLLPGFIPGVEPLGAIPKMSEEMKGILDAYEKGYSKLEAMQIKTKDHNAFLNAIGIRDKYTSLKDLAPELWDENGVFNIEAAREFLETNTQLSDEQRKEIQNIIDLKDAYDDANAAIQDYLESLFGSWGNDIADAVYDSIISGTDAFDVLNEKASEVIKTIIKQMAFSAFLKPVMDQFSTQLENSIGDTAAMTKTTADLMNALAQKIPELKAWMESAIRSAEESGIDMFGDIAGGSLGEGIKNITEDTANLLASYLNAIRADVSFGKLQWIQMNVSLKQILGLLPQSPTLAGYLAQIQANTFNTAENTARILRSIDSVTTSEGGYRAIRVYS